MTEYVHVGTARPVALDVALTVPPSGDIVMSVTGDISTKGWPSLPGGKRLVVTVGRGTQYESKMLIGKITFGVAESTLTVYAADRNFDGTTPVNAPAGTLVEHTISATEMTALTAHLAAKSAHGANGDLVDQNSAQALTNKTFPSPTGASDAATKGYTDSVVSTVSTAAANAAAAAAAANTAAVTADANAAAANANANTRIPMNGSAVVSNFIIDQNAIQFRDASGVVRYSIDQMSDSVGFNTRDANGWRSIPLTIRYSDGLVRASYNAEVGGGLTVSGAATINGAGLYIGGEFAKYVDGQLRVHMHNSGVSVYSDLGVTGALISEGQMRMSDAGRPEDNYAAQNNDRRWLVYHGDGIVRRMNETTFRLMVAAIATGSSAQFKSHIADPVDSPDVTVLRPREFRWTDDDEMRHRTHPGMRYGLIAEEVAAVDERFVMRDFDDNVVGLDQHALIAGLIAKVTELEQRIDTMQASEGTAQ